MEGKNKQPNPAGAQIYLKLEEDGHSLGGRGTPDPSPLSFPTHQSGQHLEECLFHDPKERSGQQPGQSEKGEGVATT